SGDLTWSFIESGKTPIIFTVKASEIMVEGKPTNSATDDAMRISAAATSQAFVDMANNMDATVAAMTAVPQPAAATDVPAPTDEPAATETPAN
ncbi:MAG TPA: hypothetical protein VGK87_14630, partial [Anaerolineae bacterium]